MCPRSERERRMDRLSADRFDLAVLTARAFDLDAAITYLSLAGVSTALIDRFAKDYPDRRPFQHCDRSTKFPSMTRVTSSILMWQKVQYPCNSCSC